MFVLIWIQSKNLTFARRSKDERGDDGYTLDHKLSHSCIHDEILQWRRQPGLKEYSVSPQLYENIEENIRLNQPKRRALLGVSSVDSQEGAMQPIRIFLNYDAVGLSQDRDCQKVGDIVKVHHENVQSELDGFLFVIYCVDWGTFWIICFYITNV